MNEDLFEELVQSVREMGAIERGETQPARVSTLSAPDARRVRQELGVSQEEFARALHVSVATIRNWEQQRRQPTGPARVLLTIIQQKPELLKLLSNETIGKV